MKKRNRMDALAYAIKRKAQNKPKTTDKGGKGFSVYHCGKAVYTNELPALCYTYIRQNDLKGATVGYAK